jgi:hypothetical protein
MHATRHVRTKVSKTSRWLLLRTEFGHLYSLTSAPSVAALGETLRLPSPRSEDSAVRRISKSDLPIVPSYTPAKIVDIARQALDRADGRGDPQNFQSYAVQVDGGHVAAKWLFWQVLAHAKAARPGLPFDPAVVTAHSHTVVRYLEGCGVDVKRV